MKLRFDNPELVEEAIWNMRIAEEARAADRAVLLRLFNGNPPFDEATAEENNIQININDLSGVNQLAMARRQWNNAFLKPSNFFTAKPDFGPPHKRDEWMRSYTSNANRLLKRKLSMIGQVRSTGANTMLFGMGPVNWKTRRTVIPTPIAVSSLFIPSETEIDEFENLQYFAVFREWTLGQLNELTTGPRVDRGWNMDLVNSQWNYLKDQLNKSPNSLAYQYMPERIEELKKQDKGFFGTDAVPTCDVWDFYFKDSKDDKSSGWYRRVILDWEAGGSPSADTGARRPVSRNKVNDRSAFLYSSGSRKYADSISEILHCQFGDCSAYAPFKYHSIRSLGWLLWGVCDLQNRLHCKFNESVFEQMMWFFQTASNADLVRLKKANFEHMGVLPQGIKFLTAAERFIPNFNLLQMAFARNRQQMSDVATSYTQEFDKGIGERERTATETMAIVNASQALSSGILEMGYTYEAFKYREICRRLCIKDNPDPIAREFRRCVLKDGVPENMLDVDKWSIEPEQVLGGGNKSIQMATVGFLNNIRKNLPPQGQRLVDHISVEAATDQPDLAQEMAPLGEDTPISNSTNMAQLSTDRMLRGLPFKAPKDAIHEDYVIVWLQDMALTVQKIFQRGGMATPDEIVGLLNLAQGQGTPENRSDSIQSFLEIMQENPENAEKVRGYSNSLGQLMNHVKGFQQRLQQAMQKGAAGGNGQGQQSAEAQAKIQATMMQAQAKMANTRESHAQRTQQRQTSWELEEERKNRQMQTDLVREGIQARHELMANRLRSLIE